MCETFIAQQLMLSSLMQHVFLSISVVVSFMFKLRNKERAVSWVTAKWL